MKRFLGIVLTMAMLLSMLSGMLVPVTTVSAASGVDYMTGEVTLNEASTSAGVHASVTDGVLTFNATAAGQEVALVVETPANLNDYPFIELTISSTGAFDLCFHDKNNNKWIGGASDYCYTFNEGTTDYEKLPAGNYDVKFSLTGVYTWDGSALPANAEICEVIFIAEEATTITVAKCRITDGMTEVDLNTRGNQSGAAWDKRVNLIAGDYKNAPAPADNPTSGIKVTKNDDGSVTYGNTKGLYPSAVYDFSANPIVVNDSAALDLDFTVSAGCKTVIYVFFGPSTPDSFGDGVYIWIANPDNILTSELEVGHYSGTIFLKDTIWKTIVNLDAVDKCKDANGNYIINGIKIFAVSNSATDNAVTVNKCDLVSLADEIPPTTRPTGGTNAQGIVYTYDAQIATATITGYEGTATELTIPADLGGAQTIVIGEYAFLGVTVDTLWVPDTLVSVGDSAFFGCDSLQKVYYVGTAEQWDAIAIGSGNDALLNATRVCLADIMCGDINADGRITLHDALRIFYGVNGQISFNETEYAAADVDADGTVKLMDALKLFYHISGKTMLEGIEAAKATTDPAQADVVLTVETVTALDTIAAGTTIELDVTISRTAGLNGVQLCLGYDTAQLSFVSAQLQGGVGSFDLREVIASPFAPLTDGGEVWITAVASKNVYDVVADELILTLTFEAVCDITNRADVQVLACDASADTAVRNDQALTCTGISGGCVVTGAVVGDLTGDRQCGLDDATVLFYKVNGLRELSELQMTAADVTGDGKVDLNDATMLFYIVNGLN